MSPHVVVARRAAALVLVGAARNSTLQEAAALMLDAAELWPGAVMTTADLPQGDTDQCWDAALLNISEAAALQAEAA